MQALSFSAAPNAAKTAPAPPFPGAPRAWLRGVATVRGDILGDGRTVLPGEAYPGERPGDVFDSCPGEWKFVAGTACTEPCRESEGEEPGRGGAPRSGCLLVAACGVPLRVPLRGEMARPGDRAGDPNAFVLPGTVFRAAKVGLATTYLFGACLERAESSGDGAVVVPLIPAPR